MCPRCKKDIKSTSDMTSHINTYKIPITLLNYQFFKLAALLEDNTINYLNLLLENNKKSIRLESSNYSEKEIKSASSYNNDIRPADINQ